MKWKITGSRVYGDGASYNCTNKVTATDLQNRLNNYEQTINTLETLQLQYNTIQNKLDTITKNVIQAQMTLTILQEDINKLKKELEIC